MSAILTENVRAQLLVLLQERNGGQISLSQLSKICKVGAAAIRGVLLDMEAMYGVRCAGTSRLTSYYIPTPAMLTAEQETINRNRVPVFRVLAPRKDHAEAVARARGARLDLENGQVA